MSKPKSYHRLDCFAAVAKAPAGRDSILAAPRVLDLVRLVEHLRRAGAYGAIAWLVCFRKSPRSVDVQNVMKQFDVLTAWTTRHATPQRDA